MAFRFADGFRLITASACWGLGTVISKSALSHFHPYDLLTIQLAASVLAMMCLLPLMEAHPSAPRPSLALAALGVLNPGLGYVLGLSGLAMTSASLASLLWALEPALIVVLGGLILRERLSLQAKAVAGAGAIGVALVVVGPMSGSLTGIVLILGGVGCCALYAVLTRLMVGSSPLLLVVVSQHAAALGIAVIIALVSRRGLIEAFTQAPPAAKASAVVSGILYYGVASLLFVDALRRVPAAVAGLYINLVPVFGIIGAYLLLHERLGPVQWLGAATVFCAMTLLAVSSNHGSPARKRPL
jgi:drug/metabolite transporter (DMT)-like permease